MKVKVLGVVTTYDPVRRKGFMKSLEPKIGNVHFALSMLPKSFKEPVIEASRALNRAKKDGTPEAEFKALLRELKAMVQGQRFSFEVRPRHDGKPVIERKTVRHLPDPEGLASS